MLAGIRGRYQMMVDLHKTLEQLDGLVWNEPDYDSHLVRTCHQLRKKPLRAFTIEDLRIMIGQDINLEFLIPIALKQLRQNILAEGDLYEGDLLNNVLASEEEYWKNHRTNWQTLCEIFENNLTRLKKFETTREIRNNWFSNFEKLKKINAC